MTYQCMVSICWINLQICAVVPLVPSTKTPQKDPVFSLTKPSSLSIRMPRSKSNKISPYNNPNNLCSWPRTLVNNNLRRRRQDLVQIYYPTAKSNNPYLHINSLPLPPRLKCKLWCEMGVARTINNSHRRQLTRCTWWKNWARWCPKFRAFQPVQNSEFRIGWPAI